MDLSVEQLAGNKDLCNLLARMRIDASGCWLWTGAMQSEGYGHMAREGSTRAKQRVVGAHRVAYELFVGPIPQGLHIDHLCRVRNCINPAHLEAVTPAENVRRGIRGENPNSTKTHCPRRHPYAGDNLVIRNGKRTCRTCERTRQREMKRKQRSTPEGRAAYNAYFRDWRARRRTEHEARPS